MSHLLLVFVACDDFLLGDPLPSLRSSGDASLLVVHKTTPKRRRSKILMVCIISCW